jgi:hypothetical protein
MPFPLTPSVEKSLDPINLDLLDLPDRRFSDSRDQPYCRHYAIKQPPSPSTRTFL